MNFLFFLWKNTSIRVSQSTLQNKNMCLENDVVGNLILDDKILMIRKIQKDGKCKRNGK